MEKGDCLFVCSVCNTAIASEFCGEHTYENGVCTLCGAENGNEGLEYKLNNDLITYSVVGLGECAETDIIIPKDYNGLPVTEILGRAFRGTNITSIKIPSNITEIKTIAFHNCSELKRVDIAYGVTKINSGAFFLCQKLEEITIPDSVREIGDMTFRDCQNLKSVVLGKNLTYISSSAFDNCPALESIYFKGTAQQWEELNKPYKIPNLENVTVYFYSETEPESEGNYWHYVNDKPVIWG